MSFEDLGLNIGALLACLSPYLFSMENLRQVSEIVAP